MYQVHIGKKHIAAIALCLAMLFTYSSSAFAADVFGTFSGSITSEDDVDLSGIEIGVYTAVPVYDTEDTDEVLYYGETYDFSVYTDADGSFEFDKPTEYCSVSVVLDTLPANYGVSQEVQFIAPSRTSVEITMSAIASAEARLESGNISVEFYNSDGDTVLCSYNITPSSDADTSSGAAGYVTAYSSLGAIDSMTSYIHSGTIETGTLSFSYSVSEDISDYSVIDKINYLYEQGDITEEEKIIYYCDLASPSCEVEFELECGNVLYDEITAYADSTDEISDEVSAAIAEATNDDPPSYTNCVIAGIGTYRIKVFYDANENMTTSVAQKVADGLKELYEYFVTDSNFNAPYSSIGSYYTILNIYLVTNDELPSAKGMTNANHTTGCSTIWYKYSVVSSSSDEVQVTLAHEFMHAMMATYGTPSAGLPLWFKESFASMAGLVYYGATTSNYSSFVKTYLSNSYRSIYSSGIDNFEYGTLVYPLYIYKYLGKWNTIRSIYEELSEASSVYAAITNSTYISTYQSAFRSMALRNYSPKKYYAPYATYEWGHASFNTKRELTTYSNLALLPMACHYQQYISIENIGTLYCTIEVTSSSTSGLAFGYIKESSSASISFSSFSTNFSKITISENDFGDSIQILTLLLVNTNTSGSSIIYKMTASI
ncbi:MAG: hypothetical protein LUI61_05980 [Firmicutes bacterium]|nr:hypothetical protein [Bacillota bacterium]